MSDHLYLFDFDGVICDTNLLKTQAFRQALRGYDARHIDEFIHYHQQNGGISRYQKLDHFFKNIVCVARPEDAREIVLRSFAASFMRLVCRADLMPGVLDFLKRLSGEGKSLGICSGGDKREILRILSMHGLRHHFKHIWCNEATKSEHARDSITPAYKNVTFFGDAKYDMDVAIEFGFSFVFVSSLSEWKDGKRQVQQSGFKSIENFTAVSMQNLSV